ncbi:hypothetical protein [Haloprofundus salilacus]|uniref:DUF7860 family protein n=1 Tax=Haloprofundus salilacus TaxID=2876190 RepID=UPI001CCB24EA|nr:hypothetical protein [Haloprofundus salilacus]
MTGRYGNIDYPRLTKSAFLLGVTLFAAGALAELVGHAAFGTLPGWQNTLFLDMEILGIAVALLAPLLFGVVLPLTE